MRQFPERELTAIQERIAGRRWQTRQICVFTAKKEFPQVLMRLAAFGQIDDLRGLSHSNSRPRTQSLDNKKERWDLIIFVTYHELDSSTSAIATWEFAETRMSIQGKKVVIAKIRHHDVDSPGIGVPPLLPIDLRDGPGVSSEPSRTRTVQFVNHSTGEPVVIHDTLAGFMIKSIWEDARKEARREFRNEFRQSMTEWARAIPMEWVDVYDWPPILDRVKGTATFESRRIAQLVWEKVQLVKLGDGKMLTGKWAMDPILKDFALEDGVRDMNEEYDEPNTAREQSERGFNTQNHEEESEEE